MYPTYTTFTLRESMRLIGTLGKTLCDLTPNELNVVHKAVFCGMIHCFPEPTEGYPNADLTNHEFVQRHHASVVSFDVEQVAATLADLGGYVRYTNKGEELRAVRYVWEDDTVEEILQDVFDVLDLSGYEWGDELTVVPILFGCTDIPVPMEIIGKNFTARCRSIANETDGCDPAIEYYTITLGTE